jgi:formyl-CoA transferase
VKTSLLAGAISMQGNIFVPFLATRKLPRKAGNGHPFTPPPFGIWRAKDGKELAISSGGDEDWPDFCAVIGKPELVTDPRFAKRAARLENRDELFNILQEAFKAETRDEWVRLLQAAGLWATPLCNYEELCSTSHLKDNELLVDMNHPEVGNFSGINTPVAFGEARAIAKRPPLLGEHTREVLAEAGYGESDVEALYKSGAVA